ncbi:MAG: transglutaminaseTgpA domain-containing protein [Clostridia bacterium]|nr:transglutaminaseTgpA domain-containing protein [Clostridia bacterium]
MIKIKKIKIITNTKTDRKEQRKADFSISVLLFFLAGILGIVFSLRSISGVTYSEPTVLIVSVVCGVLLWYLFFRNKKFFGYFSVGLLAVALITVLFGFSSLRKQIICVEGALSGLYDSSVSVTLLYILFSVLVLYIMFVSEFILRKHVIMFFPLLLLTLFGSVVGINLDIYAIVFLTIFQTAFIAINMTDYRVGKKTLTVKNAFPSARKSGMLVCIVLLVSMLISVPVINMNVDRIYNLSDKAEEFIYQNLLNNNMSGSEDISTDYVNTGKINRGNVYTRNVDTLNITLDHMPTQKLYMKGFTGYNYENGEWTKADDSDISDKMRQDSEYDISGYLSGYLYDVNYMHFVVNRDFRGYDSAEYTMNIQHLNNSPAIYLPYYNIKNNDNATKRAANAGYDYFTYFYEQKDMAIDWENKDKPSDSYLIEICKNINKMYKESIQQKYLTYPKELLPRLSKLCSETPLNDLNEITTFILYTLSKNTTYTTTPGKAPNNQDIIEYFLFDSGKGYCVHYATTAVMMYRMYGIPARYATGYVVPPYDFYEVEDYNGNKVYSVNLTDKSAHAWVEIYLDGYGWTPVEVTPSTSGEMITEYPGFNPVEMARIMKEHGWNLNDTADNKSNSQNNKNNSDNTSDILHNIVVFVICPLAVIAVFIAIIILNRKYRLKKIQNMNIKGLFERLIKMLHFSGILKDYQGTEEDFAEVLFKEFSDIPYDDIKNMYEIIMRELYGDSVQTNTQRIFVRTMYYNIADSACKTLKPYKKLIFKYIKIYK